MKLTYTRVGLLAAAIITATVALAAAAPQVLKDNVVIGLGVVSTKSITFDNGGGANNAVISSDTNGTTVVNSQEASNNGKPSLQVGAPSSGGTEFEYIGGGASLGLALNTPGTNYGFLYPTSDALNIGFKTTLAYPLPAPTLRVTTNSLYAKSGTAAAPTYSFLTQSDVGIYQNGPEHVGIASAGFEIADFNNMSSAPGVFNFSSTATSAYQVELTTTDLGLRIGTGAASNRDFELESNGSNRVIIASNGAVTITDAGNNGGEVPHKCSRQSNAVPASFAATVTCSGAGEIVMGGGCFSNNSTNALQQGYPSASNQFSCTFNGTGSPTTTAYAICCRY